MPQPKLALAGLLILIGFAGTVWYQILFAAAPPAPALYFLDVGQGDATLLTLPRDIKILTDAGPDQSVVRDLEKILSATDHYLDLVIITHPQLDHFNGLTYLLDRYTIGTIILNGRADTPGVAAWSDLVAKIKTKRVPLVILRGGDAVRTGESKIDFLSPTPEFLSSAELNDTGFVEMIHTPAWRALLTADTGFNVEGYLRAHFDLTAEILKVGHHGSKYSSGAEFLAAVHPLLAGIEVGAKNTYGHPSPETLARLATAGIRVFRTDQNGTVMVTGNLNSLRVIPEKSAALSTN